jgi:hypothetical protein
MRTGRVESAGGSVPVPAVLVGLSALMLAVAMAGVSQAVTLTVGPDGDYSTIQSAINDCPHTGSCAVKVQGWVTYVENLYLSSSFNALSLSIVGGWNTDFTQIDPYAETIIDGGGVSNVVDVLVHDGLVAMGGFTIRNGSFTSGAGIRVAPAGEDTIVKLTRMIIEDNSSTCPDTCTGGGVHANLDGNERLEIDSLIIRNNTAMTTATGTSWVAGGGLAISAHDTSSFLVTNTEVSNNTVFSDATQKRAGGVFINMTGDASGEVNGLLAANNTTTGAPVAVNSSGGVVSLWGAAQITIRRSAWAFNRDDTGYGAPQLALSFDGEPSLTMTDSLVANGSQGGLNASPHDSAELHLANLTVVYNNGTGIDLSQSDTASVTLYNTISFGNDTDLAISGSVTTGSNLVGVYPHFVNPFYFDYHLTSNSQAIDAGSNSPPGGLGPTDLDGNPRVENGIVDIGCYEMVGFVFYDGFESGNTTAWSATAPNAPQPVLPAPPRWPLHNRPGSWGVGLQPSWGAQDSSQLSAASSVTRCHSEEGEGRRGISASDRRRPQPPPRSLHSPRSVGMTEG